VATSSARQTPQTPRFSLSYQADPHNLFYASVAKGFRVGGGNAPLPTSCDIDVGPYQPDTDLSYEVGAKNSFFSGKLHTDISAFHVNWNHIQQIVIPACGVAYTANTGSAVVNGFNADIRASLTRELSVNLAVGYADAYFTQNVFISPGVPLVLKGDKVGFLPQVNSPWNIDAGVSYDKPIGDNAKLHFHVEYQYNSQNPGPFINQITNSPNYYNLAVSDPATSQVKARIGYEINNFDFTVYVDNLLNAHPVLATFQFPVQANIVTNATFRPRTFGLTAKMKF
jgi:outer membrane receptor protein involved in Fe transport